MSPEAKETFMPREARERLAQAYDAERFRSEGHALVEHLADHLHACFDRAESPVFHGRSPEEERGRWSELGVPEGSSSWMEALIEGAHHLHHPRSMGHQVPPPLPTAALADLLSSVLNNSAAIYELNPAHMAIERRLVEFLGQKVGFLEGFDGFFTGGGTLGNLTALLAMRQATAKGDTWNEGSFGARPQAVLVNEQCHYCVGRALQIMGWGSEGVATVAVDSEGRMTRSQLATRLEELTRDGRRVVAVAANACSTATGSFDDLNMVADFCAENALWLHVDGAHGASACLSRRYGHLVAGIHRADSLVWDMHKMMALPALCTAVLFREGRRSWESFRPRASYLFGEDPSTEWFNGGTRSLECTRPTLALKLWLALILHGESFFDDYVSSTFDLARRCGDILEASPDFDLAMAPQANILCWRARPEGVEDLEALQGRLREALLRDGRFYVVQTQLQGKTWLRTTFMNPFTEEEDFRSLLEDIRSRCASGSFS